MIIQDSSTYLEDKWDQILAGDNRDKLNYFMEKAGIDYKKVYFTSGIKCKPPKPSDIKAKHIEECQDFLLHEIMLHKPKVIIAMGKYAYNMITDKKALKEFAGHFDEFEMDYEVEANGAKVTRTFKCQVMPTYSLNASMKKWEYNGEIIRHFKKAQLYVEQKKIERTPFPKVNTILSVKQLKEFVKRMEKATYCATDFETTGFDFFKDVPFNIGYCTKEGEADVIFLEPYRKEHAEKWKNIDKRRAVKINKFLKKHRKRVHRVVKYVNQLKNIKFILHNGKFDQKFALYHDLKFRNFYFDTLMASPLIDENLSHALNMCCERNGINYGAYDTELWPYTNKDEKKKKTYQNVPPLLIEKYLGVDVDACFRLFIIQKKQLKTEQMLKHFHDVKMHTVRDVTRSEYIGFRADERLLKKISKKIVKKQTELLNKMEEITEMEDFNPNSTKQILKYMHEAGFPFKKLKIKENATGYSTAAKELQKFMKYKKWKTFPKLLLDYKKLTKIKGTYIDGKDGSGGMMQYIDQKKRIHGHYNLWTPRTGRQSSSRPSVQVWPRPIKGLPNARRAVIPTNKNWMLFEADYSQLEQCIVAALSKDKVLIDRIQRGIDLHCINAADLGRQLKTVPLWTTYEHMLVTNGKGDGLDPKLVKQILRQVELEGANIDWKEKRTQAKNIGFGLNYGKIYQTFAKDFKISESEAKEMVDAYFDIYQEMYEWRCNIVEQATTKGEIWLPSGRKRRFHACTDWINSEYAEKSWSAKNLREEIGRQAMNYPVQGGAHEVFEAACIRLNKRFRKEGMKARLMLLIHDGIVGECPKEEAAMVKKCLQEEMPFTFHKGTKYELNLKVDIDFYVREWYGEKIKNKIAA